MIQFFESLYDRYGFRNILQLLPTTFQLEAREYFRDAASPRRRDAGMTETITTLLLSGVLFLIFYDALTKILRV